MFRGKFIAALAAGLDQGELRLPAEVRRDALLAKLTRQHWVVYAKRPFAGPAQVLAYLGSYTHRTEIGNQRLVSLDSDVVRFKWRDRAHANQVRVMALPAAARLARARASRTAGGSGGEGVGGGLRLAGGGVWTSGAAKHAI